MRNLTSYTLAVALTGLMVSSAEAGNDSSGPSSKAAAAYKDISITEAISVDEAVYKPAEGYAGDCNAATPEQITAGDCVLNAGALSKSKHRILSTTLKTPKNKDLAIDVSLECGNFANFTLKSGQAKLGKIRGTSSVRVAVVVTDEKGNSSFAEPYHKTGNPGVVFCHSDTELNASFAGVFNQGQEVEAFLVTEDKNEDGDIGQLVAACDPGDDTATPPVEADVCIPKTTVGTCLIQGEDGSIVAETECLQAEQLEMITDKMSANAFNFFYPNAVSSGMHQVDVIAWIDNDLTKNASSNKGTVGATIGLGSMFVESIRMVKGETGLDENENKECDIKKHGVDPNSTSCESIESID